MIFRLSDTVIVKRSVIIFLIVSFTTIILPHQVLSAGKGITYRNAKSIGMGDAKIAGGYKYNGFVDNPALLSRVTFIRLSILRVPLAANSHLYDTTKFIHDNTDKFINYNQMLEQEKKFFINKIVKREGKWGRIFVSPMIDFAYSFHDHKCGIAFYATNEIGIKMDRGIYEPRVWGDGHSNIAVICGYARSLPFVYPGFTIGVNLKFIQRRRARLFQIRSRDLGNLFETIEPIIDEYSHRVHNTVAVDIGTLWKIARIGSEVGFTIQSIGDGRGSTVNIGIIKKLLADRLMLLGDYIDIFDNNKENIFTKFHIGAEYKYYFFVFRGGINSGYPTAGLGLNFTVFDIDFAYFSDELQNAPGANEDERLVVQLKLGW